MQKIHTKPYLGNPLLEKENNLSYLYNCDAIPFYVLIDKEGKVVAKWEHIGDVQLKELDMLIK